MSSDEDLHSISKEDFIIAVIGPTGSGKSTFINRATETERLAVGHGMNPCTFEVQPIKYSRNGRRFVLLDTPGINTGGITVDALMSFAAWLVTTYGRGIELAGIIYLHPISGHQDEESAANINTLFKLLCGENALQNVILVTTMWGLIDPASGGEREQRLRTDTWESMISSGSKLMRFMGTYESAWEIVDQFTGPRLPLQIQLDMADMSSPTTDGNALVQWLTQLVAELRSLIHRKHREQPISLRRSSSAHRKHRPAMPEVRGPETPPPWNSGRQKDRLQGSSTLEHRPGSAPPTLPPTRSLSILFARGREDSVILAETDRSQGSSSNLAAFTEISIHSGTTGGSDEASIMADDLTGSVEDISRFPVAEGGFSSIYTGVYETSKVAIKVVRSHAAKRGDPTKRRLVREMNVWWNLNHPNIVPLLGYTNGINDLPSPVSPWYSNKDASTYPGNGDISVKSRLQLLCEVSAGLRYLHHQEPAIIHGDMKPQNILIDDNGVARLCDFGLARPGINGEATITGTLLCTARYAPPEIRAPKAGTSKLVETTKGDIYSLACIAYEFLYLKRPHENKQTTDILVTSAPPAEYSKRDEHPLPKPLVMVYWKLLEKCWKRDEAKRPEIDYFCEQIDGILNEIDSKSNVIATGE